MLICAVAIRRRLLRDDNQNLSKMQRWDPDSDRCVPGRAEVNYSQHYCDLREKDESVKYDLENGIQ